LRGAHAHAALHPTHLHGARLTVAESAAHLASHHTRRTPHHARRAHHTRSAAHHARTTHHATLLPIDARRELTWLPELLRHLSKAARPALRLPKLSWLLRLPKLTQLWLRPRLLGCKLATRLRRSLRLALPLSRGRRPPHWGSLLLRRLAGLERSLLRIRLRRRLLGRGRLERARLLWRRRLP